MRYHSLEVTLLLHHEETVCKTPVRAWLLLAQDFDTFCTTINLRMSRDMASPRSQTPMLALLQDILLIDRYSDEDGHPLHPHHLRLEFGNHQYHKPTAEAQSAVISRFRSMSSSSLHIEICGHVVQTAELKDFRMTARPNLVCASSLAWRIYWYLDSFKEVADCLAHDGDLELADRIYLDILDTARNFLTVQASPDVSYHFRHLLLDTALTSVNLHLITGDVPDFAGMILRITHSTQNGLYPALTMARVFHIILLSIAILGLSSTPHIDMTIAQCIAELMLPGSGSRQLHDAAILQKCPDHSKKFECKDLPMESCSTHVLSPECINLRKAGGGIRTPDSIDGWLDKEMLRGTSNGMREAINGAQIARGWHVTRFEDGD